MNQPLDDSQLTVLADSLHRGAEDASEAMAKWLSIESLVEIDSVVQVPIESAAGLLGDGDATLCFCSMAISGSLQGQLILAFDDSSGLSLSDLLLSRSAGTANDWGEVETSAALETANIVGCAYLNAMSEALARSEPVTLMPTPPSFRREFAESLLQSAVMAQAMSGNFIVVAKARFEIRGEQLNWHLLFVPDADSMKRLGELTDKR